MLHLPVLVGLAYALDRASPVPANGDDSKGQYCAAAGATSPYVDDAQHSSVLADSAALPSHLGNLGGAARQTHSLLPRRCCCCSLRHWQNERPSHVVLLVHAQHPARSTKQARRHAAELEVSAGGVFPPSSSRRSVLQAALTRLPSMRSRRRCTALPVILRSWHGSGRRKSGRGSGRPSNPAACCPLVPALRATQCFTSRALTWRRTKKLGSSSYHFWVRGRSAGRYLGTIP